MLVYNEKVLYSHLFDQELVCVVETRGAGHLGEAEQEAGHGALLHVERQQGVGHVDEEHGAPHSSIGRPGVTVQHYQNLQMDSKDR